MHPQAAGCAPSVGPDVRLRRPRMPRGGRAHALERPGVRPDVAGRMPWRGRLHSLRRAGRHAPERRAQALRRAGCPAGAASRRPWGGQAQALRRPGARPGMSRASPWGGRVHAEVAGCRVGQVTGCRAPGAGLGRMGGVGGVGGTRRKKLGAGRNTCLRPGHANRTPTGVRRDPVPPPRRPRGSTSPGPAAAAPCPAGAVRRRRRGPLRRGSSGRSVGRATQPRPPGIPAAR